MVKTCGASWAGLKFYVILYRAGSKSDGRKSRIFNLLGHRRWQPRRYLQLVPFPMHRSRGVRVGKLDRWTAALLIGKSRPGLVVTKAFTAGLLVVWSTRKSNRQFSALEESIGSPLIPGWAFGFRDRRIEYVGDLPNISPAARWDTHMHVIGHR